MRAGSGYFTTGSGRIAVKLVWSQHGQDLRVHLSGGEDHIGCVIIAKPGVETLVERIRDHREHEVAEPIATWLAAETQMMVTMTAGIHYQDITAEEIQRVREFSKALADRLASEIKDPQIPSMVQS